MMLVGPTDYDPPNSFWMSGVHMLADHVFGCNVLTTSCAVEAVRPMFSLDMVVQVCMTLETPILQGTCTFNMHFSKLYVVCFVIALIILQTHFILPSDIISYPFIMKLSCIFPYSSPSHTPNSTSSALALASSLL